MRKCYIKIVALCLTLCLLLTGCSYIGRYFSMLGSLLFGGSYYTLEEMEYVRPDMESLQQLIEDSCTQASTETKLNDLLDCILAFNGAFDDYYTAQALAMIHYCRDMTNAAWEEEYNFCTENAAVLTAGVDRFYRVLAKSPLREQLESDTYFGPDFFDDYEGESIFDDTFTAMLTQEAQLQNDYFAVYAESGDLDYYSQEFMALYGARMAEILVELVQLRQQIGQYAGYDSYAEFAYSYYHARDFSPSQTTAYLADIRDELVPLYRQLTAAEDLGIFLYESNEKQTYAYVENMANKMGGVIQDAFLVMSEYDLYDIAPGANKYNASFETYIRNYATPYVFLNPTQSEYDHLTFAHEFGHFCNDFASYGSIAGVDVAEVFSQGMEYLSLCYGPADENLQKLKMLDCLRVYVEQAAYASFEQQLYEIPAEELSVDKIGMLYADVCRDYGLDSSFSYVLITHFYTSPMYVISSVISNDAALQLYQMEQAETGAGLVCYAENLATVQPDFLAFLEEAGLESPFANGRIQTVKQTLESILKP